MIVNYYLRDDMNVTNVFLIILFAELYCLLVKNWLKILHYQIVNVNRRAIRFRLLRLNPYPANVENMVSS